MKIYTKTGDQGETSLWRGGRVPKNTARLEAYGTLDEVMSALGLARALLAADAPDVELDRELASIQADLLRIGSGLSTAGGAEPPWHLGAERTVALEAAIDRMEGELPPLTQFVLPGGDPAGAALHVARTVCRRAERAAMNVHEREPLPPGDLAYLNRLSDYLFVVARWVNRRAGRPEVSFLP